MVEKVRANGKSLEDFLGIDFIKIARDFAIKQRFYYALQIAEQTIRYLSGFLKDFPITIHRRIKGRRIQIIIEIDANPTEEE